MGTKKLELERVKLTGAEIERRDFLGALGGLGLATAYPWEARAASRSGFSCNAYAWTVFYRREGRDFMGSLDRGLGEVAASGISAFEPLAENPDQLRSMGPLLEKHALTMPSLYVNSTLHEPELARASMESVLQIAEVAVDLGARVIVTNPNPIDWGRPVDKSDAQLRTQASALQTLGEALRKRGMTLAYHNHDAELRQAAREFHHMMVGTDPTLVKLCLDSHWIYRGAGHSELAVLDVVELYARRIVEMHIRQSRDHIWTEYFRPGDLDYELIVAKLHDAGIRPLLVLEQAVEEGSPHTMDALEAHRKGLEYARRVFGPLMAGGRGIEEGGIEK